MTTASTPTIAIVGSGPSGCYLAQSLLRSTPDAEIVIIDRLVSPFGLVRYGVAADHQHTKAITRQFDRLFQGGAVRFAGDIGIGRDLSLAELRAAFDVVVLATGLTSDRGLALPGAELPGIIGAGTITRVLNAHPDEDAALPELGRNIVVIGAGNVALDILRFLVKGADDYADSDIADEALAAYLGAPAERVTVLSRSGIAASKGDPQMIRELAQLPRASYRLAGGSDGADGAITAEVEPDRTTAARIAAVAELVATDREISPGPEVELHFGATPIRVLGNDRVAGIEIKNDQGIAVIPADTVITAIGFRAASTDEITELIAGLEPDAESGRIDAGLYRAGWAQRGPRGAIPENRTFAKRVADEIAADLQDGTILVDAEKRGFDALPDLVRARAVGYEQWLALEAHERELAPAGRVRRKIPDHDRMGTVARGTTRA